MKRWTDEDLQKLVAMRAEGLTFREIGKRLGRDRQTVNYRWYYHNLTPEQKAERNWTRTVNRRAKNVAPVRPAPCAPPPEIIAERDYRAKLKPRDLTASICGDPPVGFSAYDKKLLEARRDLN